MTRILLLEDDVSLIDGLEYALHKNGFTVETARTELAIIAGIMVFSVILAIRTPVKKLREMSITDTLHMQ